MIKVEGLTKSFGRQAVLRELTIEVATGTITIIIGRSGGGKSVFLTHLIGLMRPDAGRITVDGVEITRLRGRALDEVRRTYGVVFQGGALFDSMSCWDNVAFPLREKVRTPRDELVKRVEAALGQVGREGVGAKYPAEISGGMGKRVAIARALVTEPEIIFFDEPTTGLDPVLVKTIHDLMLDVHRAVGVTAGLDRGERGRRDRAGRVDRPGRLSGPRHAPGAEKHQAPGRFDRLDQDEGPDRREVHPDQPGRIGKDHRAQRKDP